MKITLTAVKPRNPLVAAARTRRAGIHRPTRGALRQTLNRSLRHEVDQLDRRKDSP
ncbi:MAG: hypothetical protein KF891_22315 [Rhizobacter sp.]|nr:hypothetical protein [Rhizobacter sp.]